MWLPSRKAAEKLGLHPNTLRKYADNGTIPTIRNAAGQRLYDVNAYLRERVVAATVCYCRVSSAKQRDDLDRQVERMQAKFPEAEIVKDIGSGLNFKRKGLLSLLGRLMRGDKLKVCVVHRDRLARFSIDLIRFLIEHNGGELMVLDPYVDSSKEAELTADLMAILHHFSCRMHGSRSHQGKADTVLSESATAYVVEKMARDFSLCLQRDGEAFESAEGDEAGALDGGSEDNSIDIA
jgi:putative resolvase